MNCGKLIHLLIKVEAIINGLGYVSCELAAVIRLASSVATRVLPQHCRWSLGHNDDLLDIGVVHFVL